MSLPVWMRVFAGLAFISAMSCSVMAMDDVDSLTVETLREAHLGTDGPSLLQLFRQYVLIPADRAHAQALIIQLNADEYEQREAASEELVELGPGVGALLRQATQSPALEVSRRARRCLARLGVAPVEVLGAAARVLAVRKPPGSVDTLLAYLPQSDDEQLTAEIQATLTALAFHDGEADPALVKALSDAQPVCRAAAVEALAQAGGRQSLRLLKSLLHDPDAGVRLRVARHQADMREADAIAVLIGLVADKAEVATEADAYLRELAGSAAPTMTLNAGKNGGQVQTAWEAWWNGVKPRELVEQVRKGTPDEASRIRATELIEELGDDDFTVRERASEALVAMGAVAWPLLQRATKDGDAEVAHRATECLAHLRQDAHAEITPSVVRLIALSKPIGASAALIAYLPFADEGPGVDEVQDALVSIAYRDGRADDALLHALADPLPLRRRVAGTALARAALGRPESEVFRLLKDPSTDVRLAMAITLVELKQRQAVPNLINLVGELPAEQAWPAEDLLGRLARDAAPGESSGDSDADRKQRRDRWLRWWQRNAASVDMARLDQAVTAAGRLLVTCYDGYNGAGRIWELGADHKPRWEIKQGLRGPIDAVMIGANRILVAEYNGWVT